MSSTKKTTKAQEPVTPEPRSAVEIVAEMHDMMLDAMLEGKDAPLTDQIYGIPPMQVAQTDPLPIANREFQGLADPLQRFISQYEPGELILRQNFRRDLLRILEDWRLKDVKE
jgi:hypothetical protein